MENNSGEVQKEQYVLDTYAVSFLVLGGPAAGENLVPDFFNVGGSV